MCHAGNAVQFKSSQNVKILCLLAVIFHTGTMKLASECDPTPGLGFDFCVREMRHLSY
jgi:hypothetical protein